MSDNNDRITIEVMRHLGLDFDMIDDETAHVATISLPTDYAAGAMHIVSVVWVDENDMEMCATVRMIVHMFTVHTSTLFIGRTGR